MNIFFLHLNPKKCARYHVDKHVVKMILESIQLLSAAHHVTNSKYIPRMKKTHINHPCSIWVRESVANYMWLIKLTRELCKEYTYRYNKTHKCEADLADLEKNIPPLPNKKFTVPATACPDVYKTTKKTIDEVIEIYRSYYFFEKYPLFAWKNRKTPSFITEYQKMFE